MRGIISYGTYLPRYQIDRAVVGAALGTSIGNGRRSVASYDEDSTTLGLEASRAALDGSSGETRDHLESLIFSTSTPAYLDKTNATAIHAALSLPGRVLAFDSGAALRSGVASLITSLRGTTSDIVVAADLRGGRPGSDEETSGGDAGAALVIGEGDAVIAEYLGGASTTAEFHDRWRLPGETSPRIWEERFAESVYLPLLEETLTAALKNVGLTISEIDSVIVTGTHSRSVRSARRLVGQGVTDDLTNIIGQSGTGHPLLLLAAVLENADPGKRIVLVSLADGVDILVFQTTSRIGEYRPSSPISGQLAEEPILLDYPTFLSWRGFLDRQLPRRPSPSRAAAPPAYRSRSWKFGLEGSQDEPSGAVHLPPQRVSYKGGAIDHMLPVRRADSVGTVATFTIDHLTFSMSPPTVIAVIDFDGGGRYTAELTDVSPEAVEIGLRVQMTFRRIYTVDGIHNYFWKARPVRAKEVK